MRRAAPPSDAARRAFARALALAALAPAFPARAGEDAAAAALARGGHALLLRHATTDPGVGDPPGFRLGDCATQRNLSAGGRAQARALGAALAARGMAAGPVLSSRWCRCLDTARLAFGRVEPWPAVDSFFGDRADEPARTKALRARIAAWTGPGTLVVVTHQVNITAATGEWVAMGAGVVVDRGGRVVGSLPA